MIDRHGPWQCEATPGCAAVAAPIRLYWRTVACVYLDLPRIATNRSACVASADFDTLVRADFPGPVAGTTAVVAAPFGEGAHPSTASVGV